MNWSWLLPSIDGIPVLIYHKVWPSKNDQLTITPERLREHFQFLKNEGYRALGLDEYMAIMQGDKPMPKKVVLITFDDGYRNNLTYAYPLLKELGMKATFFIIANTLMGEEMGDDPMEQKMTREELQTLDPAVVQLALHGYSHRNMAEMTIQELDMELSQSIKAIKQSGLQIQRVFAYPYGARPQGQLLIDLKKMMKEQGIIAAFRIGNKPSTVPPEDVYEIKRIDVRGTETLTGLAIKLKKGKLKPF
jgi:peptidoglycan/xylan/chitin deacetylase (PgdA/CDA1 family)